MDSSMPTPASSLSERAHSLYEKLRSQVEIPENIGKLIVLEVESEDYEIDEKGIETSRRLQVRHPNSKLFALRIGYKTVDSLGAFHFFQSRRSRLQN
jgi:hypothetical protein